MTLLVETCSLHITFVIQTVVLTYKLVLQYISKHFLMSSFKFRVKHFLKYCDLKQQPAQKQSVQFQKKRNLSSFWYYIIYLYKIKMGQGS